MQKYKTSGIEKFTYFPTKYHMKNDVLSYIPLIDKLAEKRFPNSTLAVKASMYVLSKLEDNNWKRIRDFKGQSKFSTFLSTTTRRLLEDFSRKEFKRVRPPSWLKKLGGIWLEIFRYLCLDRYTVPETVESMVISVPTRSREKIEEAAQTILLEIHDCGSYHGAEFETEDDKLEYAEHKRKGHSSQDDNVYEKNSRTFLEVIFQSFLDDSSASPALDALHDKLPGIQISLNPTERLLLKMRFVDGLSVSAACRNLNLKDADGRKVLSNCLTILRNQFEQAGLDEQIKELLSHKDHTREFGLKKTIKKKQTVRH